MSSTVKPGTKVGIDPQVAALRLRLVAKTKTPVAVNFGKWMRYRRVELHLRQRQVAERLLKLVPELAPDKQRVSDWENGVNLPSDGYKPAIVKALQVEDVSYFFRPFSEAVQPDVLDILEDANEAPEELRLRRIEAHLMYLRKLTETFAGDEMVQAVQQALRQEAQQDVETDHEAAA